MDTHPKRRPQIIERSYDYKRFADHYHRDDLCSDRYRAEGVPKCPSAQNPFQTAAKSNCAAYGSSQPLDGGLRFMKTLLISFVLVVNLCLTNGVSANAPPTEITDTFFSGEIVQYYQLVGDGEIKYVGMIRYGQYYVFAWMKWDVQNARWHDLTDADILEIRLLTDGRYKTVWSLP